MKTIAVVTTSRADYGVYLPVLERIECSDDLKLFLIVSGMHLRPEFGMTVHEIERVFSVGAKIETIGSLNDRQGMAESIGQGVIRFAQFFGGFKPDILVVLGDRFEMLSATLAAVPFSIPIAHICGGSVTEGAMDDSFRHCISKLAQLHFVEAEEYKLRLCKMGENPNHVIVSGSPSLDNLKSFKCLTLDEINKKHGTVIKSPYCIVTFHPVTHELSETSLQISELFKALDQLDTHIVFSNPNADPSGQFLRKAILEYAARYPKKISFSENFGTQSYFSLMHGADAMIGNSSSGIMEAPSFGLPVVNVGSRQMGRLHPENVVDVGCSADEIVEGFAKTKSPQFQTQLKSVKNPFVHGVASDIIVNTLENTCLKNISKKQFFDFPVEVKS